MSSRMAALVTYGLILLSLQLVAPVPAFGANVDQFRLTLYALLETHAALLRVARESDRKRGYRCEEEPEYKVGFTYAPEFWNSITFPADAHHPHQGNWVQRFWVLRCGERMLLHAAFEAERGSEPRVWPWLPGSTAFLPNPKGYEIRAEIRSRALSRASAPNCRNFHVLDTFRRGDVAATREMASRAPAGVIIITVLREMWTVRACGEILYFDIQLPVFSDDRTPIVSISNADSPDGRFTNIGKGPTRLSINDLADFLWNVQQNHERISEALLDRIRRAAETEWAWPEALMGLYHWYDRKTQGHLFWAAYWLERALQRSDKNLGSIGHVEQMFPEGIIRDLCNIYTEYARVGAFIMRRAEASCAQARREGVSVADANLRKLARIRRGGSAGAPSAPHKLRDEDLR